MAPPFAVRTAALVRDVTRFKDRIERTADGHPSVKDVAPLYDRAEVLSDRAKSLMTSLTRAMNSGAHPSGPLREQARNAAFDAYAGAKLIAQATGVGPHAEVVISNAPGSSRSAERWNQARDGADLPNVRIVGNITQSAANLGADRLENVPEAVVRTTDALGHRGILFSGRLTDVWGNRSMRGVQPRGWPKGSTWDSVPGAADQYRYSANPNRELTGRGHGSTSLVLHEFGHTVDWAMSRPKEHLLSITDRWKRGPQRELRRTQNADDYFRNYPEEWYAESFARYTKSPQSSAALARWYPETYAFHRRTLGSPRFGD